MFAADPGIAAFDAAKGRRLKAVGSWFERRWAEYLTVLATVGTVPVELNKPAPKVARGAHAALDHRRMVAADFEQAL